MTDKDPDAYRTISEVAEALDIPPHVLRFWETKFPQIKPLKRGGGRRFYRRADVDLLRTIRRLLYDDAYTIRGVQRLFKAKGAAGVPTPELGSPPDKSDEDRSVPASLDMPVDLAEPAPTRILIERLATEIAACQAVLSDALRVRPVKNEPVD